MIEEWRPAPGYEGLIDVSSCGRVRTLDSIRTSKRCGVPNKQIKKGVVMRPFASPRGYPTVAPKFGQVRKKLLVHRLVAKAFIGGYFEGATVNHIDGVKTNNRIDNLEWLSKEENTREAWRTGLVDLRGERQPTSKLTRTDIKEIKECLRHGETQVSIGQRFGVSSALISLINAGKRWRT